jgi:hypothetical protein
MKTIWAPVLILTYGFIYFILITPIGFIYRNFFLIKMKIKKEDNLNTYWIDILSVKRESRDFRKPY